MVFVGNATGFVLNSATNLGGNISQDGNPTPEAALATQNADLQRNNMQWLDGIGIGIGDGKHAVQTSACEAAIDKLFRNVA